MHAMPRVGSFISGLWRRHGTGRLFERTFSGNGRTKASPWGALFQERHSRRTPAEPIDSWKAFPAGRLGRPLLLAVTDTCVEAIATLRVVDHVARRHGPVRLLGLARFRVAESWRRAIPIDTLRRGLKPRCLCGESLQSVLPQVIGPQRRFLGGNGRIGSSLLAALRHIEQAKRVLS
jgi:hypothetical protein